MSNRQGMARHGPLGVGGWKRRLCVIISEWRATGRELTYFLPTVRPTANPIISANSASVINATIAITVLFLRFSIISYFALRSENRAGFRFWTSSPTGLDEIAGAGTGLRLGISEMEMCTLVSLSPLPFASISIVAGEEMVDEESELDRERAILCSVRSHQLCCSEVLFVMRSLARPKRVIDQSVHKVIAGHQTSSRHQDIIKRSCSLNVINRPAIFRKFIFPTLCVAFFFATLQNQGSRWPMAANFALTLSGKVPAGPWARNVNFP